jgi:predicted phosphate transport protein (TIGR00153 family)
MKFNLLPRDEKFFVMLQGSATQINDASSKLLNLMNNFDNLESQVAAIKVCEESGDQQIHDIMAALHKTFVAPMDHEDIATLAGRLDDVLDAIEEIARTMMEYKITQPTPYAIEMANIIAKCGKEIELAIGLLHFKGSRLKEILPYTVELNSLENQGDQITSRAIGELFSNETDPIVVIKWRDIYHYLEQATDRAEDVANVLEAIVLKNS